jgi:hypothetical protein
MRVLFPVIALLALAACQREAPAPAAPVAPARTTLTARPAPNHSFEPTIAAGDFAYHVQTLASDEFEGRAPGTRGEQLALEYLKAQFERLALAPAANGSYLQAVPMVSATTLPESTLTVTVGGKPQALAFGEDVVFGSRQEQEKIALAGTPLVFAGYGVTAPAWNWDDYAGLDLEKLRLAADQRGFEPQALPATLDASIVTKLARTTSYNAVALLPGTTRKDELVVYSAHWDHLGKHEGESGDNIYNGARDNASGVAGVLEIAEAFVHAEKKPARSVLFLIDTLEESGLVGTRYYTEQPLFSLEKTVAEINLDDLPINGRSKDMIVIGYGQSTMDDLLAEATAAQGRRAGEDPDALRLGFYYRSDHFNFARHHVPVLYARGGPDLVAGGVEAGRAAERAYIAERYHKPADEFDPAWDFSGVIEDLQALHAVGAKIASGEATPAWKPGAEFAPAAPK